MPKKESNLCYAGLSVPTDRLPDLVCFEEAVRKIAFEALPETPNTKAAPAEVKYSQFRHISPETIDYLGQKLDYFLTKNGASIFGFFVPAEGFMNYKLRSDFIDEADALKW